MTGHHPSTETGRSKGNLGQKKAQAEKKSDEKLEHMGSGDIEKTQKAKEQKEPKETGKQRPS